MHFFVKANHRLFAALSALQNRFALPPRTSCDSFVSLLSSFVMINTIDHVHKRAARRPPLGVTCLNFQAKVILL
jgi:hypothetical protein